MYNFYWKQFYRAVNILKFSLSSFRSCAVGAGCCGNFMIAHIVPCEKFHRNGGAPPETFSSGKYDAPEEVGGDR